MVRSCSNSRSFVEKKWPETHCLHHGQSCQHLGWANDAHELNEHAFFKSKAKLRYWSKNLVLRIDRISRTFLLINQHDNMPKLWLWRWADLLFKLRSAAYNQTHQPGSFTAWGNAYCLASWKRIFIYIKGAGNPSGHDAKEIFIGVAVALSKTFLVVCHLRNLRSSVLFLIYRNAPNETNTFFYKHYFFIVQAAMLPLYAFITYILFKSPKLYYAEALVMNVYMLAFMSVLIVPINILYFSSLKALFRA